MIIATEQEVFHHADNDIAPVAYLKYIKLEVVDKAEENILEHQKIMRDLIEKRSVHTTSESDDILELLP